MRVRCAVVLAGVVALGGCGSDVTTSGTLGETEGAFSYDPAGPPGAELTVSVVPGGGATTVELRATGLLPNRGYAAHAHTRPCGPTGDAAGPHFQHRMDPVSPSVDPAYANPRNEIWLDLRTDGEGAATGTAEVPFAFTERAPASVVVHEAMATMTEAGKAGTAGGRLACLTAAFG